MKTNIQSNKNIEVQKRNRKIERAEKVEQKTRVNQGTIEYFFVKVNRAETLNASEPNLIRLEI